MTFKRMTALRVISECERLIEEMKQEIEKQELLVADVRSSLENSSSTHVSITASYVDTRLINELSHKLACDFTQLDVICRDVERHSEDNS